MSISLYDATVPSFLQILGAASGMIDKAEVHCAEKNIEEKVLLGAHFGEDMLPLSWQLKWLSTHSVGAIKGVRAGLFQPDRSPPAETLAAFREQIQATIAALKTVSRDEMEGFIGNDMIFSVPAMTLELPFTAENFLLSFSLPNFYFHATTAYDLLRDQGVSIGKRDFLGAMRIKMPA